MRIVNAALHIAAVYKDRHEVSWLTRESVLVY